MVLARAVAAAAAVWVGLHLVLLVLSLEESDRPVVYLASAAAAVVATGYALAPLLGARPALGRGPAAALVLVYVAVAAVVTPTLSPAGFVGYANWWPGGLAPVLAALVLRRRPVAALVAALGGTVALAVGAALTQAPGDRLGATLTLAFPLAVWPLGALVFRAVLDRADTAVADLRSGAAQALARARREDAHDVAAAWVLQGALPLLEDRAAGRTPTAQDKLRAQQVERAVRDEIRGGRLLDARTREHARLLRDRGWEVTLDDHGAHDIDVGPDDDDLAALLDDLVRTTVRACLEAPGAGRLELMRPVDPVVRLTVLVHGPHAVLDDVAARAHEVVARRGRVDPRGASPGVGHEPEAAADRGRRAGTWALEVDRDEAAEVHRSDLWLALVQRA